MKLEKLDNNLVNPNNINNLTDLAAFASQNKIPSDAIMLDKNLLPSRGKFYPEQIYTRKLNTLAIKNLSTLTQDNVNNVINNVLKQCVYGIDTSKILIGDKIWLIFYLRSFTYNDFPFKLRGECPACHTVASYSYTLDKLDVTYLDKEVPDSIELPNGDKLKITFPTISTEAAMTQLKGNEQLVIDINPELLELSSYISNINGKNNTLYQGYEYLCNMPADAFSIFANELSEYVFSARPYANFKCVSCGEDIKLQMAFAPAFFMPKLR